MSMLDALLPRMIGDAATRNLSTQSVVVEGSAPSIAPTDRTLYLCSSVPTALTLSSLPAASGLFEIVFVSGSIATEITLPENVLLPEGISVDADTIYDLSVRVYIVGTNTWGLAALQGWPVPDGAVLPVKTPVEEET